MLPLIFKKKNLNNLIQINTTDNKLSPNVPA